MGNTKYDDIVMTTEFVKILKTIQDDTHSIMVLSGTRKSGKTTVLNEYKKLETNKSNLVLSIDM